MISPLLILAGVRVRNNKTHSTASITHRQQADYSLTYGRYLLLKLVFVVLNAW